MSDRETDFLGLFKMSAKADILKQKETENLQNDLYVASLIEKHTKRCFGDVVREGRF